MVINNKSNKIKVTNNASYRIVDNTIYVFLDNISDFMTICKKINLVMEDNNLAYVNISMANLEDNRKYFLDFDDKILFNKKFKYKNSYSQRLFTRNDDSHITRICMH